MVWEGVWEILCRFTAEEWVEVSAAESTEVWLDECLEAGVAKSDSTEDDGVEDKAVERGVGVIGIRPSGRRRGGSRPAWRRWRRSIRGKTMS